MTCRLCLSMGGSYLYAQLTDRIGRSRLGRIKPLRVIVPQGVLWGMHTHGLPLDMLEGQRHGYLNSERSISPSEFSCSCRSCNPHSRTG